MVCFSDSWSPRNLLTSQGVHLHTGELCTNHMRKVQVTCHKNRETRETSQWKIAKELHP